jgi:hypothetical protein
MDIPKEYASQYEMLRYEVVSLIAETRKLEFAAVAAVATLYAWLAESRTHGPIWFIGVPLVLLAGIRSWTLFERIAFIAGYLRQIEAKYFTEDPKLPGYERYFERATNSSQGAKTSRVSASAIALWVVLLATSVAAPFVLDR